MVRLGFRAPYDWAHILDFLATRAVPGVERADARGYARTVVSARGYGAICVDLPAGTSALVMRLTGAACADRRNLSATARRVFDLSADPARIRSRLTRDSLLGPLVRERPGLRIPGVWEPFECAVRAVLGQQVSVAAGRTFAARLVVRAGTRIPGGVDGLTHAFPTPEQLAAATLEGIGLTATRAATLRALARATLDGTVDFSRPASQLRSALATVPGIGPWTVEYVLLRALGEADALPEADLVLRRMAAPDSTALTGRQLAERSNRWRPWRGYAVMHLWRAARVARPSRQASVRHAVQR
ncbi:MAG: DNA-3-methyladenine glycosylase 2 family protein [Proteobacteria bacterium]|nr:DNA-3-methyladenine glycosylase 2 family protein [Pseudomonadota bacterium]